LRGRSYTKSGAGDAMPEISMSATTLQFSDDQLIRRLIPVIVLIALAVLFGLYAIFGA